MVEDSASGELMKHRMLELGVPATVCHPSSQPALEEMGRRWGHGDPGPGSVSLVSRPGADLYERLSNGRVGDTSVCVRQSLSPAQGQKPCHFCETPDPPAARAEVRPLADSCIPLPCDVLTTSEALAWGGGTDCTGMPVNLRHHHDMGCVVMMCKEHM